MPETIGESFVNQLRQYYQQKPAAEPAINRGHRSRDFKGGRINRLRPLNKRPDFKVADRLNDTAFTSTAAPIYTALNDDYYISVAVGPGVAINLPLSTDVEAGKVIVIKDTLGGCAPPTPIIVAPVGPDTIERGGPILMVAAFQVLRLVTDGVSNWEVI